MLTGKYLTKFRRILLSALKDLKSLGAEVASCQLLSSVTCLTATWRHISQYLKVCGKCQVSQDQESKKTNLKYETFQEDKTQP